MFPPRLVVGVLALGLVLATPAFAADRPPKEIFETDLNSAAHGDLTELPGITDELAEKIIAARPFKKKSELLSKKILNKGQYAKVRKLIVVLPMATGAK